ncbi:MAG: hypothetical protein AB7F88_06195 [Pyrinomonadaceae bacterium]
MKLIIGVFAFIAAFFIGAFAGSLFWQGAWQEVPPVSLVEKASVRPANRSPHTAHDLLGTWSGTWGRDSADCSITIDRVDGNEFFGVLNKTGTEVRFEGAFDPKTGRLHFYETEVIRLRSPSAEWLLGRNWGILSEDGRSLIGAGRDSAGEYSWAAWTF